MRLGIVAVGRLRAGPEKDLIDDYLGRAGAAGRGLALGPFEVTEIDERKAQGKAAQSAKLLESVPSGTITLALDERGKPMTSPDFAQLLARHRDDGCAQITFLIGGADGLDKSVRLAASGLVSFGPMVWPHMLARVMLAEQLYRAVSILAGSPYHRV